MDVLNSCFLWVASSVTFLSRFILQPKKHPWTLALESHSGYKAANLIECVCILHDSKSSRKLSFLAAVREKYKKHKARHYCIDGTGWTRSSLLKFKNVEEHEQMVRVNAQEHFTSHLYGELSLLWRALLQFSSRVEGLFTHRARRDQSNKAYDGCIYTY